MRWPIIAIAALLALAPVAEARAAKVKVVFHVMSKCPYGVTAEQGFLPVYRKLRRHVDWRLEYIGTDRNGKLGSMHGHDEVQGDILQLCARRLSAKRWTTFLECQNQSWRTLPTGWEACARQANIKVKKMRACFAGLQGEDLLRRSLLRSKAANASGSPTIVINGKAHKGGRSEADFTRAVCHAITGRKPAVCKAIPPEPVVRAFSLSDRRCPKCEKRIREINHMMKRRFFPRLKVTNMDWSSAATRKLYRKLGLTSLPTVVFEKGVEKASKFNTLNRFLDQKGAYWVLTKVGVTHDPTREICHNGIDDTGNGRVDCADAQCKQTLVCRKKVPRKLDVFIMSQCPYGVRAVNALKQVLPHFRGRLRLGIHYIATKTATGFSAMHGQSEVDENIRQLCAMKHYARRDQYLKYIWCRFQGTGWRGNAWQKCATGGISPITIERCWKGAEGKQLLEQDIKLARTLGIGASPTWLANNRHTFSGISATQIWTRVCKHNKKLKGCKNPISAAAEAEPFAGGCQASPPGQAPAAPASPTGGGKVGIKICDEVLEKYERCIRTKIPQKSRATLLRAVTQWRALWRKQAKTAAGRASLQETCKTTGDALRMAMQTFKCRW